jgi:hypothetical protein
MNGHNFARDLYANARASGPEPSRDKVPAGEKTMMVEGGCHCGFIAYQADIDADSVGICHCSGCQTLTGTAFRTFALTRESGLKLLSGQPKPFTKVGESGARRV